MILLAVDTGTEKSAYVIVDTVSYEILDAKKIPNEDMLVLVRYGYYDDCVVEMFSSYGGGSGREVFESVVMVGRVMEACVPRGFVGRRIRRLDVKKHICQTVNANDAAVIRALKDRFGDKGTKDQHGYFWGMRSDCWQAFALAVAYIDNMKEGEPSADKEREE